MKTDPKPKNKVKKGTLRRVLCFVGKYRFSLVLSVAFAAISAVLSLYIPILTGNAIDAAVGEGNVDFDMLWSVLRTLPFVYRAVSVADGCSQ